MIHPLMKIGNMNTPRKETFTRVIYERLPYTLEVDTVRIGGIKTCAVKRIRIGESIIRAVVNMFDKDGKIILKQKIK